MWKTCALTMRADDLLIKDFNYELPDNKIACYPLPNRDESKLLIYKEGTIETSVYKNVAQYIPQQSFLVFNNTKVVEVRLLFYKSTGSKIELFCLEPADEYKDITSAMLMKGSVRWKCLVGGAKKWKDELLKAVTLHEGHELVLTAEMVAKKDDSYIIEFTWNDDALSFAEILHLFGNIPLPPYLNRIAEEEDKERYQTIYARFDGSVAAPTAGLHFTDEVFQSLHEKGIETGFVTLHVGAGTFKPVKTESVVEHQMHAEFIDVSVSFLEKLIASLNKKVVAVGTTSLRTLESLYWLGVKTVLNKEISAEELQLLQWEVYNLPQTITTDEALQSLHDWMVKSNLERLITRTQIIIVPGYHLKVAEGLITNFHQPQSTLLLLIASIVGEEWKRIYHYALENEFRFLSYGDGSLLWKRN